MDYIKLDEAVDLVIPIPESSSGDTVTYEIINSSGTVLASGNATFVRDEIWKASYTPTALGVIIFKVNDTTITSKRENIYRVTGTSLSAPTAPSGLEGYCTVDDVKAYFLNKNFTSSSAITEAMVEAFIADDARVINSSVKKKYSLPITDEEDLTLLKSINVKMTVGTLDDIFREKTPDGKFDRGRGTRKEAMEMLKDIREGTLTLVSARKASVIKFNNTNSDDETVVKRFTDAAIEPNGSTIVDLETRSNIRIT